MSLETTEAPFKSSEVSRHHTGPKRPRGEQPGAVEGEKMVRVNGAPDVCHL